MGFKTDSSFLRFLSIGAVGARAVMNELASFGFTPIELERYCTSNKIWATKIKRLRLPDIICVETGLRVEVRAKTNLAIKVSHAENNPARAWDSGLRDEDLVAFITCFAAEATPRAAPYANYFSVAELRRTFSSAKLGPPKSASEGSERDLEWPSTVPARDGVIEAVTRDSITALMDADNRPARRQAYRLVGRQAYVRRGDRVTAEATIIAGAPRVRANPATYRRTRYNPLRATRAAAQVDRYAAAKCLRHRREFGAEAIHALLGMASEEEDQRIALEAAASAAALGSEAGERFIGALLESDAPAEYKMEAVFILTELHTEYAERELARVAAGEVEEGTELRQAAVWGLGKKRRFDLLLRYVSDEDDAVALHAIASFGPDTPRETVRALVEKLDRDAPRVAAAACEALRIIGSDATLHELHERARRNDGQTAWVLAALGSLDPQRVESLLRGTSLLRKVEPLLLLAKARNWVAREENSDAIRLLRAQHL